MIDRHDAPCPDGAESNGWTWRKSAHFQTASLGKWTFPGGALPWVAPPNSPLCDSNSASPPGYFRSRMLGQAQAAVSGGSEEVS